MAKSVAIVGAGAMAQLYAALLQKHDIPTVILRRPDSDVTIQSHQLLWSNGDSYHYSVQHAPSNSAIDVDTVLLLTKAQDAVTAATSVLSWLSETVPLVLLHNGLGPQFKLAEMYPNHNLWAGSVSDGATCLEPYKVAQRGIGIRKAGALTRKGAFPHCLTALGFSNEPNIELVLWHKLTVNAVINAVCGRSNIVNGGLLDECYQQELMQLCSELGQLAATLGIDDDYLRCYDRVISVATATASNRCSTVQDIDAGRTTELAYISGYLLELANKNGLALPTHQRLYRHHQQMGHTD